MFFGKFCYDPVCWSRKTRNFWRLSSRFISKLSSHLESIVAALPHLHLWIIIIIIHPRTIHHDLCWQVINSSELTWVSAQHPKLSFDKARFKLHPLTHTSHSLVSSGAAPQQTIHFNYKHYEETRIQIIRYLLVTAAKPLCAIPIPRTSYTSPVHL